jgi:hypothetical protein
MAIEPRSASATRNRRSEPRWRTPLQSGKIFDERHRFLIDCQIYDRSAHGVRIRLVANILMPGRIRIFNEIAKELFDAKIAWQRNQDVGLRILSQVEWRHLTRAQIAVMGITPDDKG